MLWVVSLMGILQLLLAGKNHRENYSTLYLFYYGKNLAVIVLMLITKTAAQIFLLFSFSPLPSFHMSLITD